MESLANSEDTDDIPLHQHSSESSLNIWYYEKLKYNLIWKLKPETPQFEQKSNK